MNERMEYFKAFDLAEKMVREMADACEIIHIAGSLRRKRETVKDIEIVCVPRMIPGDADLFGEPGEAVSALDACIRRLCDNDALRYDQKRKIDGTKYKRFSQVLGVDIALDLFITQPENFGNVFFVRTGDADFTRLVVTERWKGGLMPKGMQQADGYLWQTRTGQSFKKRIDCPTEEVFFAAIGLPVVPPQERNKATAERLMLTAPVFSQGRP